MDKKEFILYINDKNPGFYKTRKTHLKNVAPNILEEIDVYIKLHNLTPINFNDSIQYYINDYTLQNICKICKKVIPFNSSYCSNSCKKQDTKNILLKGANTLKEKYGENSPLKIKEFKDKFKNTCLEKFGAIHPAKNEIIKNKIKESNISTYKDNELCKNLGDKISLAYKNNSKNILEKRKQSNLKKTGEYAILTSVAIKKAKDTLNKIHGIDNPFEIHENTYEKAKIGSIKFYSDINKKNISINKRKQTNFEKYGYENLNKHPIFQEKKRTKIQEKLQKRIDDKITKYDKFGIVNCICKKENHEYIISLYLLNSRLNRKNPLCTICNPPINHFQSFEENELYNFISNYVTCKQNVKNLLPKFEADILIENKKLIFEFNGIYWHSDIYKGKNYHQIKTNEFKKIGYNIIHIWEDLWYNKKEIVYDKIKHSLGISNINLNARSCSIKEVNSKDSKEFLDANHIQGFNKSGFYNIGLFYKNELIYLISVSKRKILNKNSQYELLRVCAKLGHNIRGAFSKLFKYIINKYPGNYIAYADLSWGEGDVYSYGGFKLYGYTKPNYWYIVDNRRYHRYSFRKSELVKLGYDPKKTEFQIMDEDIKALRIYDCGNVVWKYELKK